MRRRRSGCSSPCVASVPQADGAGKWLPRANRDSIALSSRAVKNVPDSAGGCTLLLLPSADSTRLEHSIHCMVILKPRRNRQGIARIRHRPDRPSDLSDRCLCDNVGGKKGVQKREKGTAHTTAPASRVVMSAQKSPSVTSGINREGANQLIYDLACWLLLLLQGAITAYAQQFAHYYKTKTIPLLTSLLYLTIGTYPRTSKLRIFVQRCDRIFAPSIIAIDLCVRRSSDRSAKLNAPLPLYDYRSHCIGR